MNDIKNSLDRRLSGVRISGARARAIARAAKEGRMKRANRASILLAAAAVAVFLITGALAAGLFRGAPDADNARPLSARTNGATPSAATGSQPSPTGNFVRMELIEAEYDGCAVYVKAAVMPGDNVYLYYMEYGDRPAKANTNVIRLLPEDIDVRVSGGEAMPGYVSMYGDGEAIIYEVYLYAGAREGALDVTVSLFFGTHVETARVEAPAARVNNVRLDGMGENDAHIISLTASRAGNTTYLEARFSPEEGENTKYYAVARFPYYHARPDCGGMTNATEYASADLLGRLGYTPCRECYMADTDDESAETYYTLDHANYYHSDARCGGMKDAKEYLAHALIASGKTACPVCIAQTPQTTPAPVIFYANQGGRFYHTDRYCMNMKPATTMEPTPQSNQLPCPNCVLNTSRNPLPTPAGPTDVYYATQRGEYYHIVSDCGGMINASAYNGIAPLLQFGKMACPNCVTSDITQRERAAQPRYTLTLLDNNNAPVAAVREWTREYEDGSRAQVAAYELKPEAEPYSIALTGSQSAAYKTIPLGQLPN